MSGVEPAAGRLLAMSRDCEGLASHFIMLDQRRYADGIALAKIWYAFNRLEHTGYQGLPEHVNASDFADSVVAMLKLVRAAAELAEVDE